MAHLVKRLRKNPATGMEETYFLIQQRGRPAVSLGFCGEAAAARALRGYKADLERGLLTTSPATPAPASIPTVVELWGSISQPWPTWPACRMLDWLDARGAAAKTRRQADTARRAFVPLVGHLRLDMVTPAVWDGLLAEMRRRGLRSRTLQIYGGWLLRSLRVAVDDGVLPTIPKLRRPPDTDRRSPAWHTTDQTGALLRELDRRVADGVIEPDAALAIRAQEALVMRPGEVLSRRWTDVDWKAARLAIRPADLPDGTTWKPKAGSDRVLSVPPGLLRALREHWLRLGRPADGWIFPGANDGPRGSYKKALAGACAAAGLPVLYPHALRHTGATRLAIAGVERRTVMAIGGWKTGDMLNEVYEHTTDARAAEVLAAAEVSADQPPLTSAKRKGDDS